MKALLLCALLALPCAAAAPPAGVGLRLKTEKGKVVVVEAFPGAPASAAGLAPGDVIVAVDGKQVSDFQAAADAIKGEAGTKVVLEVRKGKTKKPFKVPLVRKPLAKLPTK
ncbi:MAG: PDZ domain-containing protein [Elusimicrobiota bacterium]